ncbi:MAG: zinc ABC transporter substrate-binding protein [Planctomycetes bacterium]|nr:zinc ABC transporter substrate-binding protein [Planctomycetota bacterium]
MSRGRFGMRAAGVAALAAVVSLLLLGCTRSKPAADAEWPDKPGPKVVVSFAPLYCFAANVAGDDAIVRNVMTTSGPHDFNPTADHVRLLTKADLLFAVGLGLDPQTEQMQKGSGNAKLKLVELGKSIPKDKLCEGHCEHAHHAADHKHDDDPHVWLSPDHAAIMVNAIRDELKAADPVHAAGYDARAAGYVARLGALKAYGLEKFKGKKDNRLVSFHDSLAYFEKCYGLEIRGVLTQKAGQEPDDKQMKKLIRICADENKPTRVIAVEPQYSNSTSGETLKKELVAKGVKNPVLVEIDTLETVRPDDLTPDWYEKKMRENIDKLAAALE